MEMKYSSMAEVKRMDRVRNEVVLRKAETELERGVLSIDYETCTKNLGLLWYARDEAVAGVAELAQITTPLVEGKFGINNTNFRLKQRI